MGSKRISSLLVVAFCVCVAQSAERIIYVDGGAGGVNDGSSWTDAYAHLQDALAAAAIASETTEIRVAQGVYRPDEGLTGAQAISDATFQVSSGVTLNGGYAGVAGPDPDARDVERYSSTLSGSGAERIVTVGVRDAGTALDGFTITGGAPSGVWIEGGSPILSNCTFEQNAAGMYVQEGNPVVTCCSFRKNTICAFNGLPNTNSDLFRCLFVDNGSASAVTVSTNGVLRMRQCSFRSNKGVSVLVVFNSTPVTLTECEFIANDSTGPTVDVTGGVVTATQCSFIGNSSSIGVFQCLATEAYLAHCLFTGNTPSNGGATVYDIGRLLRVSNCTFAGNRSQSPVLSGACPDVALSQCIVHDGPDPFEGGTLGGHRSPITATYCNIEGGYDGLGNNDVDPAFVHEGYWADPNDSTIELGPDDAEAVWVPGDYHLQSQAGHWDEENELWIIDASTSPCIDAGDPNGYLGAESFPNGGYVNLGAYGGTLEASRSYFGKPVCENQLAGDINGDCIVDQTDMDLLLSHWLMDATEPINLPPAITLIAPQDGAEFTWPEPIVFRVEASDPDGSVERVDYFLRKPDSEWYSYSIGPVYGGQENGWEVELDWANLSYSTVEAGTYKVWARATDDKDARTNSSEVTITVRPQN